MKKVRRKIFWQILKNSIIWKMFCGYIAFLLIAALIIGFVEPTINSYGDALWYSFVAGTTIGFGDLAAATIIGRIITVLVFIYSALMIAVVTAVFTQFFIEIAKAKHDASFTIIQHDLEHLSELPKERLEEISAKMRELRK